MPAEVSPYDPRTLAFYNTRAVDYATARPDRVSRELEAFLPRLAPASRVLELGCGAGYDAAELERQGHSVDATDGSAAMAALASRRLSRPARVLRFDELEAEADYDAVIACASLLHVPHAALPSVLARIHRALRPGGWHFASYKTEGRPGWDRHDRYYNRLSRTDADRFYAGAGPWDLVEFEERDGEGYFAEPSRWLFVTARKG
ncbi:class I SAM-dependent methyltransferase [Novosphingobium olei]|uniref:class I SAM-dependent methyltransferase n=1 Tax=Novosphingobium olei TaxID=2728851 RepID=UPI00308598D4|nr:class I SAM-dependent methyltransferase [Novosphingobium olei]